MNKDKFDLKEIETERILSQNQVKKDKILTAIDNLPWNTSAQFHWYPTLSRSMLSVHLTVLKYLHLTVKITEIGLIITTFSQQVSIISRVFLYSYFVLFSDFDNLNRSCVCRTSASEACFSFCSTVLKAYCKAVLIIVCFVSY